MKLPDRTKCVFRNPGWLMCDLKFVNGSSSAFDAFGLLLWRYLFYITFYKTIWKKYPFISMFLSRGGCLLAWLIGFRRFRLSQSSPLCSLPWDGWFWRVILLSPAWGDPPGNITLDQYHGDDDDQDSNHDDHHDDQYHAGGTAINPGKFFRKIHPCVYRWKLDNFSKTWALDHSI